MFSIITPKDSGNRGYIGCERAQEVGDGAFDDSMGIFGGEEGAELFGEEAVLGGGVGGVEERRVLAGLVGGEGVGSF